MKHSIKTTIVAILATATLVASTTPQVTHTLSIAGTADLQGMMEPIKQKFDLNYDGKKKLITMGGIDRIATIYKELKAQNPNTLTVTTGDDLMNKFFHTYKGKAIMSLISDAGYDIVVFGNHEFDKGNEVLASAIEGIRSDIICSDLNISNSPLKGKCKPYLIKNMDGIKVGLFSLMTENFPLVTAQKDVILIGDNITMANKMVKKLQAKGVDVVILLSHIGYKNDVALAKQVKGIDLIFGGHSHHYVKEMGHVNGTAIVNGGEKGTQVIKVDIPLTKENKVLHREIKMTKIPALETIISDETIKAKVADYASKFPAAIVLGETNGEWNMNSSETRKGESTVADMINDMMRKQFKVDIVLNNGGAFRGQKIYPVGPVTDSMLKEIDEFNNNAYILNLKGKYLKPILEWGAANYGEGGFLQVSGIKYRITLPKQKQIMEGEKIVTAGERVDNIQVHIDGKWQDIDPNREYKILSSSFIVKNGGDGYFWFAKYGTNLQDTYASFYSIMADYLYKEKVLTPKAKDGRVKVVH